MSALLGLDLYEAAVMHQAELRAAAPVADERDAAASEARRAAWRPAPRAVGGCGSGSSRPCLFRLLWAPR